MNMGRFNTRKIRKDEDGANVYRPVKSVSDTIIVTKKMEEEIVEEPEKKIKEIYIGIAMDASISFSLNFPEVYEALGRKIHMVEQKKKQLSDVSVKYGLTLFSGTNVSSVKYGTEYFTEDGETFMKSIRNIVFRGGNLDGYENINEGIMEAIKRLGEQKEVQRGLVVYTDSYPRVGERRPDFRHIEGCENTGLRFAVVYCNEEEGEAERYLPQFKIVDGDGDKASNNKNTTVIESIKKLSTKDGQEEMEELVSQIMYQTSVMSW